MKKLLVSVLSLAVSLLLVSCIDIGGGEYKISFSVDGKVTETTQTGLIEPPDDPEKAGYVFDGWFYDEECTEPLGAYDKAEREATLYAGWRLDCETLINRVAENSLKANVTVYSASYNTGLFGAVTEEASANGSGIIFKETSAYYYCLTNCHVTERREGYAHVKFSVTDCYENTYDNAVLVASSAEYDLAVIKFAKGKEALRAVSFAEENAEIGDTVIALTQPKGQKNTVTVGTYIRLAEVTINDDASGSNVTFPVMYHTAPVDHGSSGGVLLNTDLRLIGINYAIATDKDGGEFLAGLAIPLDKVKAFLNTVHY